MGYVAIAGVIALLVLLLGRAFLNANPATLARGIWWVGGVLAALLLIVLYATEQLGPAVALTGGLLALAVRAQALRRSFGFASAPRSGKISEVETDLLRMTLDHESGAMEGSIRQGRYQGRRLTELSLSDLIALWRECRAGDEASAKLLETYLDRASPGWRTSGAASGGGAGQENDRSAAGSSAMTREEAYLILDLKPGASRQEVKAAYHRLMLKLHPDHGGSTYLAARLNLAKDLLLKTAG